MPSQSAKFQGIYCFYSIQYRSYGILLYEFVTGGSVPYANFSNNEVKSKVGSPPALSHPLAIADL